MKQGLLLFAHGARDPRWAIPFDAIAERVRAAQPAWQIELAFLEFMQPDLRSAGRGLADAGCEQVAIVPLFLGAGGHVRKDLPALLLELEGDFPDVQWQLRPAIGEIASVIAAMADAAVASVDKADAVDAAASQKTFAFGESTVGSTAAADPPAPAEP